jgi:arylsulfatase A-like enzyme
VRRFTARVVLLTLAVTSVAALAPRSADPVGPARAAAAQLGPRPNFVVIYTDDQVVAQLPYLWRTRDLIGEQGLTFTNSVTSYPLCCPSRASFLTGQYVQNHGIRSNGLEQNAEPLPRPDGEAEPGPVGESATAFVTNGAERGTFAVALRRSGYFTAHVGKYLNGYGIRGTASPPRHVPPGWDDWRALRFPNGQDYWHSKMNINGELREFDDWYQTDLLSTQAMRSLDRAVDSGDPFYLEFVPYAPHGGRGPIFAPRHANRFRGVNAPRPPSYNEEDTSDKPFNRPLLDTAVLDRIDRRWRAEARSLLAVDNAVARIVDRLRAVGELNNTVLIFTSDNGFYHAEHRISRGKFLPYEPAVRVPLVVAGPMIPAVRRGTTVDAPVANIDLAATILDYARANARRTLDGRSLRPLFQNPVTTWNDRAIYLVGVRQPSCDCPRTFSGLRLGNRWAYWRWEGGTRPAELYDLRTDPDQLTNLANDPAHADVVAELEAQRQFLTTCRGDQCRQWHPGGTPPP